MQLTLLLFGVTASVFTVARADNADAVVKSFIMALDKMDIPADRKAMYKGGLEKSRTCIGPIVNAAPPERVTEYAAKLGPIFSDCSKMINEIPHDNVAERQAAFASCMKDKVSTFEQKEIDVLVKIRECLYNAMS